MTIPLYVALGYRSTEQRKTRRDPFTCFIEVQGSARLRFQRTDEDDLPSDGRATLLR